MTDTQKVASLSYEDAVEGGLFDAGEVDIPSAKFVIKQLQNTDKELTWLEVTFKPGGDVKEFTDYFLFGDPQSFVPSQDGRKLLPVADKALDANSTGVQFMRSLRDAGVSKQLTDAGDIQPILVGGRFKVIRVNQKKNGQDVMGKNNKPRTYLKVDKVIKLPGEQPAAGAKATKPAAAAPKASGGGLDLTSISDELREKTIGYIAEAVSSGPVARKAIASKVFPIAMKAKDTDMKQVGLVAFDAGFLAANSEQPIVRGEGDAAQMLAFVYNPATEEISKAA